MRRDKPGDRSTGHGQRVEEDVGSRVTDARLLDEDGELLAAPRPRLNAAAVVAPLVVRIHRAGQDPDTVVLDPTKSYAIGRSATSEILFDDDRVSRHHATLKCDDGWKIVDAMSSNGTIVCRAEEFRRTIGTEERLAAQQLHPGEIAHIAVGNAVLVGSKHQWLELLDAPSQSEAKPIEEPGAATRRSMAGKRFHEQLQRATRHSAAVFLLGSSGAGKTHAARTIHESSGARGRFVALNCAALPSDPTQLRSTLFGHVRGAFTGAEKDFLGRIYEAHEGSVFLDEVESLPVVAQGFLLDVIEGTGDLLPLGIEKKDAPRRPVVRFLSASKLPLKKSPLRMDLAHRLLSGDIIRVPSLADRTEDIPGFLELFLEQATKDHRVRARFASRAVKALQEASWPGEIRELQSLVEATVRACVDRARGSPAIVVQAEDVLQRLDDLRHAFGESDIVGIHGDEVDVDDTAVNLRLRSRDTQLWTIPIAPASVPSGLPSGVPTAPATSVNPRKITAAEIRFALSTTDGNIERAASRLGIARRTLMKKMDDFGIDRPHKKT